MNVTCPSDRATFEKLEERRLFAVAANSFLQTNLVSDTALISAATNDPNLQNPWGLAINPANGAIWIADNGTGLSTAYTASGTSLGISVTIPLPGGAAGASAPTGTVFNGTSGFKITKGPSSGASTFIFATEDGTIAGWNPGVDPSNAVIMVDNSLSGAVYKGLALGKMRGRATLYAANFHAGTIDVFDSHFNPVQLSHNAFVDRKIPTGFAPFNDTVIHNQLFVSYAKQDLAKKDDVPLAGNGFVDIFNTQGRLLRRFASRGVLDSPWAVTRAPANSGPFAGDILVGNFGDGKINVFRESGAAIDQLKMPGGTPAIIDGLWSLRFGNGVNAGTVKTLFFTAGPNAEAHGLFGTLTPV